MKNLSSRNNGIYTKNSRKKGDKIIRYEGNIVPNYIASVHHSMTLSEHFSFEWKKGNIYDHVNHSCKPNCYIDMSDGVPILLALRDISSDEELCYNYNSVEVDLTKDWVAFPCHCKQSNCVR